MPRVDPDTIKSELLRLSPELHRYLSARIPPALAVVITPEDVAQEVWTAALVATDDLGRASIQRRKDWIFTIARNELRDALVQARRIRRGGGKRTTRFGEHRTTSYLGLYNKLVAHDKSPGSVEARVNAISAMQIAIGGLAEEHRDAIRCRYIQGMSEKETAEVLGRSPDGIRGLVFRGMQKLRRELSPKGGSSMAASATLFPSPPHESRKRQT